MKNFSHVQSILLNRPFTANLMLCLLKMEQARLVSIATNVSTIEH